MKLFQELKKSAKKTKADFILIEIGGTVGEYQNLLFLEAARMMKLKDPERRSFCFGKLFAGSKNDRRNENKTDPICGEKLEFRRHTARYNFCTVLPFPLTNQEKEKLLFSATSARKILFPLLI